MLTKIKYKFFKFIKNGINEISSIKGDIHGNKLIKNSNIAFSGKIDSSVKITSSDIEGKIYIDYSSTITDSQLKSDINIAKKVSIDNSDIKGIISIQESAKIYGFMLRGKINIGRYTSLWGPNSDITSTFDIPINIGNFCSIARHVSMQTFNHNKNKITTYYIGQNLFGEQWENEKISDGGIIIGNDVWIGAHVVILGNVKIGNGAIVAANSVVNKDVPPYAIVGGNPAKILSYRFNEDIIIKLQEIKWWDWNIDKIQKNKFLFQDELSLEKLNQII